MIIKYIKSLFTPKFLKDIEYIKYFKKEQMVAIKTENGIEKIPVSSLDKSK